MTLEEHIELTKADLKMGLIRQQELITAEEDSTFSITLLNSKASGILEQCARLIERQKKANSAYIDDCLCNLISLMVEEKERKPLILNNN
jgi:hypothetical protein